jgi:threonine dehydrogenase-like Zn-dependent dehydrogenase
MWTATVEETAPVEEAAVKALVKAKNEPGLWLQDVPEPTIEADEVLIKVLRTGLCGTDLHIQNWDAWAQKNVPVPMVTGHEFCGEVVEIGAGARNVVITDLSEYRLELARKLGVTRAVNVGEESIADAQRELGMREGFDVGMEMSGQPVALRDMLANMNHGGKIAMLGLPSDEIAIDWGTVVLNMLTIKGIYGREMFETWYSMSVMLERGLDLGPVITHRFGYADFELAFDTARHGQCGKVIMDWTTPTYEEKH